MRISYEWLKNYIDIKLPPERAAEALTMAGLTVESIKKTASDAILEIEVTANRPDWLSYIGVARELAAITGGKLKAPAVPRIARRGARTGEGVTVTVDERVLCSRYTARIIGGVKVGGSQESMKKQLEAMGLRSINNIVDITNFCLFESGEPMHAFDLDKIDGGEIIIRKARPGERITTIDGVERPLEGSTLVIADRSRPIAIAGVMGGLATEVTHATKNILLEAAFFDPISVRRTAKSLGLATESSYRFERRVDPDNIVRSSDRAAALICAASGGECGEFIDIGKKPQGAKAITLRAEKLNAILGLEIPWPRVKKIAASLEFKIKSHSGGRIKVEPPSFRGDIGAEIDIIEEIARIYGYDKIPNTIPAIVEQGEGMPFEMTMERFIRRALAGAGFDEIMTYSLVSRKALERAFLGHGMIAEIKNPLSIEQEVMRPGLMPGMLSAMLWNINRRAKDLKLFEIGKVYTKAAEGRFLESKRLSIAVAGEISGWAQGARPTGFFDLKGAVEMTLEELGIKEAVFKQARYEAYSHAVSSSIEVAGEDIGSAGEVTAKIRNNFDIKEPVYFCEISLEMLARHASLKKRFKELPQYPSVHRDMSFVAAKDVANLDLIRSARDAAGAILKEIKLIDRYAGKQVPDGKIGLTYRLEYQDPSRTLEEKDVSAAGANILKALEERFGAKLR